MTVFAFIFDGRERQVRSIAVDPDPFYSSLEMAIRDEIEEQLKTPWRLLAWTTRAGDWGQAQH